MAQKEQLTAVDLKYLMEQDDIKVFPLDVRSQLEYDRYHIKGSLHIHIENLSIEALKKALSLNNDKEKVIVVTYCNAGGRGGRSFSLLKEQNTNRNIIIKNLNQGINEWIISGFEIEENV